jgi:hypothetical protein
MPHDMFGDTDEVAVGDLSDRNLVIHRILEVDMGRQPHFHRHFRHEGPNSPSGGASEGRHLAAFWPAYLIAGRIAKAKRLKLAMAAGLGGMTP